MLIDQDKHDEIMDLVEDEEALMNCPDVDQKLSLANNLVSRFKGLQLTVKQLANSLYGGFGTNAMRYSKGFVASTICSTGRFYVQLMDKMINDYFRNKCHLDTEWFDKLKKRFPELIKVDRPKPITEDICNYSDTDSFHSSSLISTNLGTYTVEELFEKHSKRCFNTPNDHEFARTDLLVENWTKKKGVYFGKTKHLVRHKVSKEKWTLRTKRGKEITVTGDHSLVVFRDNKQLSVRARDVKKTDKILIVRQ